METNEQIKLLLTLVKSKSFYVAKIGHLAACEAPLSERKTTTAIVGSSMMKLCQ
jgi:hypothetical protein